MVFSSIMFIFLFLPIVLLLYHLSQEKYRNIVLLISSLVFYAVGEEKALILMVVSITVNYIAALLINKFSGWANKRKLILIFDIIINLGILYYFKYLDYTITVFGAITGKNIEVLNIALPIGISFFTFQAMSYVIDVYKGTAQVERNILNVGLYISFFPQLVAGPIVRYTAISEQIKKRNVNLEKVGEGTQRFLIGFGKKVILANNLAVVADKSFNYADIHQLPVAMAWFGSIAFSLQIYFDFSGYSDMAIGLGKMFGFDFSENFNYPYLSKTITEFWRRWHISLSQWFRDYVYIPLGGSRCSIGRTVLNLFAVWALTGLWHGANATFVAWGLMYFVMLVIEKYLLKPEKRNFIFRVLWQVVTLFTINSGWILFNTESFHKAVRYLRAMFGWYGNPLLDSKTIGLFQEYGFFFLAGVVLSLPVVPWFRAGVKGNAKLQAVNIFIEPIGYMLIFVWAVSYLILGAHNPFIYFNF